MSEIVQKHLELMTVEFEDMSRTSLFTPAEVRIVMKKRREFEYKIGGVHKKLQDFKDYIEYEEALLKAIKLRRDKLKIGDNVASLEQQMAIRIKSLYQAAIRRYSSDLGLYLLFFKFCKQVNYVHAASSVIKILLKHFPLNVESWQIGSKWYAYDRNDVEKGIKILYKGITLHKNSQILYTDLIKLEILKIEQASSSDESQPASPTDAEKTCNNKIKTYMKEAFNNIDDYTYFLGLLMYLEDYIFTAPAQNMILDYLFKNFGDEAEVKQVLEQRNYKPTDEAELQQNGSEDDTHTSEIHLSVDVLEVSCSSKN